MRLTRNKNIIKTPLPKVFLGNNELAFVSETKYLGFVVDQTLSNVEDITKVRNKFYSTFNILLRKFHYLDSDAFFEIFKSYCMKRRRCWPETRCC